ncbi:MAG: hypothetical protein GY731_15605, partial [Gammaproteobacteria bacterium]|nr:hypothetical protein [Gammaproteobacteria bacterium]
NLTISGVSDIYNNLTLADGVTLGLGGNTMYFRSPNSALTTQGADTAMITLSGGQLWSVSSNVTLGSGVTVSGSGHLRGTTIINDGMVASSGGTLTVWPTTFSSNGTLLANTGSILAVNLTNPFSNTGIIDLQGGTVSTNKDLTNAIGGTIQGVGSINLNGFDLINDGIIAPGNSPGRLTINGDLLMNPGSVTNVEIAGTDPVAPEFDIIDVTGSATLDGTLNITHFGGFTPTPGDGFKIITCGVACTNDFTAINPPATYTYVGIPGAQNYNLINSLPGAILWDNEAGTGMWDNPLNWVGDVAPIANDTVIMNVGGGTSVTYNPGTLLLDSLYMAEQLDVASGSLTITTHIDSSDQLTISGGSLALNGTTNLDTVNMAAGTLAGTGTVTVNGAMNWNGGTISGASTNVAGTAQLNLSGGANKVLSAGSFNNAGMATWTDT